MNRRTMLATLASAALLPTTRLFADGKPQFHGHHPCDKKFAEMITALEHLSWNINTVPLKPKHIRLKIAEELIGPDFFEVLGFGYLQDRKGIIDTIASGIFLVQPDYAFWNDFVVRTSETSALINYRMIVEYTYGGVYYKDDIWVTSSYALIKGRWKYCSYHETYNPPPPPPELPVG